MQRSKSPGSAQRFLSVHASVQNTFNVQRHLDKGNTLRYLRGGSLAELVGSHRGLSSSQVPSDFPSAEAKFS